MRRIRSNHRGAALQHLLDFKVLQVLLVRRRRATTRTHAHGDRGMPLPTVETSTRTRARQRRHQQDVRPLAPGTSRRHRDHHRESGRSWRSVSAKPLPQRLSWPYLVDASRMRPDQADLGQDSHVRNVRLRRPLAEGHHAALHCRFRPMARRATRSPM